MRGLRPILLLVLPGVFAGTCFAASEYIHRFTPDDKTQITSVAVDAAGNTYVCGYTWNPAAIPEATVLGPVNADGVTADSFVMKIGADGKAAGALVFGGGRTEYASRIAVDPVGNVVVYGHTESPDFPTKNALQPVLVGQTDVFVCKFDESCTNVLFSTLWGGSEDESSTAMAIDGTGDIVIAGSTSSQGFPAGEPSPPIYRLSQPFVAKLAADGSGMRYAFRFGGSSGPDRISAVAADEGGDVFLTGQTYSFDFPTLNALQDFRPLFNSQSAFVAKLRPDGSLAFSTYLGGDYYDMAEAITVNDAGEIIVAGHTWSEVFPSQALSLSVPVQPAAERAFLLRLDPLASRVLETKFYAFMGFSVAMSPHGGVITAGTVYGYAGLPFIVQWRNDGSELAALDRLGCDDPLSRVTAVAVNGAGDIILVGDEWLGGTERSASYVAKYGPDAFVSPAEPQVRLFLSPGTTRIGLKKPITVSAAVAGAPGTVSSVRFYAGKKLIGKATNAPFRAEWTNSTRGVYNLRAVAVVDGKTVKSCPTRVTVASPRNDKFANRIRLVGETVDVPVDANGATLEPGEERLGYPYESVWYSWTAPRDGVFAMDLTGDGPSRGYFQVLVGTQMHNLSLLIDSFGQREETISVRGGETYHIRISEYPYLNSLHLRIWGVTPPSNDFFTNALELNGGTVSVTATTRNATTEPGEFPGFSGYGWGSTTWCAWAPPAEGRYLVALEGRGYCLISESTQACPFQISPRLGRPYGA